MPPIIVTAGTRPREGAIPFTSTNGRGHLIRRYFIRIMRVKSSCAKDAESQIRMLDERYRKCLERNTFIHARSKQLQSIRTPAALRA
jgi:hypothetical protein